MNIDELPGKIEVLLTVEGIKALKVYARAGDYNGNE